MASLQDTIKILIQADGAQAVREIERVGKTSQQQLDATGRATRDWSETLTRTGAGLVAFSAVSGAALYKTAQAASDLSETVNKTNVIFGDASSKVIAYGDDASQSIGQSKQAALEAASTFGGLAKGIGLTADESADFAIKLTTLSSDLASFGNTTPEEAVLALGSALRGESEPIRRYNVLLNEAAIKQEAYASGIAKQGEELTEQQKVQARYNVILKQTTDAQGDFARTSDGAANQQRILSAELKDLQANVGTGLLPIFTKLVETANSAVGAFSSLSPETQNLIGSVAGIATVGAGAVGAISLVVGQAMKMKDAFGTAQTAVVDFGASLRTADGIARAVRFAAVAGGVLLIADLLADSRKEAEAWANAQVDASASIERQIRQTLEALDEAERRAANAVGFELPFDITAGSEDFQDAQDRVDALNGTLEQLRAQLEATGRSQSEVDGIVAAASIRYGEARSALRLLNDAYRDGMEPGNDYGAAVGTLDQALADLVEGGKVTQAVELFGRLQQQSIEAGEGFEDLYGSFPLYVAASRNLDAAAATTGNAQEDLGEQFEGSRRSVERLTQEYDAFYDRVLSRRDTVRDAATAQLDVADSLAQVQEAQARYNELVASGTATQAELSAAQRDAQRATIDYYGSIDDAVAAIRDAIAIQAGYEQGTRNSRAETDAYIGALKAQRDALSGPLREALDAYITQLEAIPEETNTRVTVDNSQALAAVQQVIDALQDLYSRGGLIPGVTPGAPPEPRAVGGPVSADRTYLVGEKGPELFVPSSSGSIVPNHALKGSGGTALGGGGEVIHVHFHGPVAGSQRAMERMMIDALKSARRRGDRDVA